MKGKRIQHKQLIVLLVIFLMSASSIVYYISQAPGEQTPKLPKTLVFKGEIDERVEEALLSRYATIVKFYHEAYCKGCEETSAMLERIAKDFRGQVYVVEVEGNVTQLIAYNVLNYATLPLNGSEEDVTKTLCKVVVDPPDFCLSYLA